MDPEREKLLNVDKTPMFVLKKKLLLMTLFIRYFFCGLEYSIIMPTALLYMKSLGGDHAFMGLIVGLYPLAAMFTLPLFGYLYDRTKRIRELLIVLNLFQIVGNFIYAIPFSKWLPLVGRFLGGVGDAFISVTVGEITYLFDESNILGIFSLLELGRVLGLILGPTINFVIVKWTIHLHHWTMDNTSLPGFIMGCCWILMQLITIICVNNLALQLINEFDLNDSPYMKKKAEGEIVSDIGGSIKNQVRWTKKDVGSENEDSDSDSLFIPDLGEALEDEKEDISIENSNDNVACEQRSDVLLPKTESDKPAPVHVKRIERFTLYMVNLKQAFVGYINGCLQQSHLDELLYVEFIVLFLSDLVLFYSQTTVEIILPYVTEFEYKWGPQETGAVYMGGGVVIIIMYVLMFIFRKYLAKKEFGMIVCSLVLTEISLGLLICETSLSDIKTREALFITMTLFVFISMPLNMVCLKTLLTRLARPGLQGVLQGFSSGITKLARIGGPLIGTFVFKQRQAYGASMAVVCFITIICLFLTYSRIVKREKETREKIQF